MAGSAGLAGAVLACALFAGCTPPHPPLVVTDPDPSVKIPAYKKAVEEHNRAAEEQMVADLESDDPAVRFFSICALQRLTGQTFGYRYYESEPQRLAAVARWRAYVRSPNAPEGPATSRIAAP